MDNSSSGSKPSLIQVGTGIYIDPVERLKLVGKRWVLLDERGYKQLGVDGFGPSQRDSMRRLSVEGFIRISVITPRVWLLDVESWLRHLDRCANAPWFWDRRGPAIAKLRRTYRK